MITEPEPLPAPFRRLAWSNLAAQSAEQVALAAVPMLAVLALGAGAAETGLLAAAQTLPFLLLSLPLGVLADRARRRRHVMAGAEFVRVLALALLPLLALLGQLSIPLLAVLGFLGAVGTVAYSVAAPSLVPAMVPRTMLAAANGRLELARSLAYAGGPALAGALVGWAGAAPAFALAAGLSLVAAVLLLNLPEPERQAAAAAPPRSPVAELRDGACFAWQHELLRPILLTAVAWNLSWFVLQAAYAPYALRVLGLSPAALGGTLGAYGAGMVAGALLAPRMARALPFGQVILVGPFVSVLAALLVALSALTPAGPAGLPAWLLPGAGLFLFGAGPVIWTIAQTTLRQAVTPHAMLGRVSALVMMATFGARPTGAALGGWVGSTVGLSACVALAACGFLVQAGVIALSPVKRLPALPAWAA